MRRFLTSLSAVPESPTQQPRWGALAAVIAVLSLASVSVAGQAPTAGASAARAKTTVSAPTWTPSSRTPDGQPDLQGIYTFNTLTPLERPRELGNQEFFAKEEVAKLEAQADANRFADRAPREGDPGTYNRFWAAPGRPVKVVPSRRTSLITDPPNGRKPPLTPEALKKQAALLAATGATGVSGNGRLALDRADSWEDRDPYERCIARAIPRISQGYNHGIQIVQTPGYVVIHYESMHDTRIIPLDGRPHVDKNIRLWIGDSVGRWEGNTLVVDTTNFTDKVPFEGIPQGNMHFVERFTRIDSNMISDEVTVDDPTTWTRPWTFVLPWEKDDSYQIFEYACHEGNEAMVGILAGARAEEKAAEDASKKESSK